MEYLWVEKMVSRTELSMDCWMEIEMAEWMENCAVAEKVASMAAR